MTTNGVKMTWEPIDDWSTEGRSLFLGSREEIARTLLEKAFAEYCDTASLSEFRFCDADPVAQAAEWCIVRFTTGVLDPDKITSRSMKLFTDVNFWLAQREGKKAYKRIMAERNGARRSTQTSTLPAPAQEELDDAPSEFAMELSMTLRVLRDRTCRDMVGYWFEGSKRFRQLLSDEEWVDPDAKRTPKERSLHVADALFRFLALHLGVVREKDSDEGRSACVETWFRPCVNKPMYEVERRRVNADEGMASRKFTQMRERGLLALIRDCVVVARATETEENRPERLLARWSLRATLLARFKLEDNNIAQAMREFKMEGRK